MSEIIYILTNPCMQDLIKIGRTDQLLEDRMKQLSSPTGVPVPFECYYAVRVKENASKLEKDLHYAFSSHRVNERREFFEVNPERVKVILEHIPGEEVTPERDIVENQEEQKALNKARKKRPNFRFSMADIEAGAEINFIKDKEITARVENDRKINFNGRVVSITDATKEILCNSKTNYKTANSQSKKLASFGLNQRQSGSPEKEKSIISEALDVVGISRELKKANDLVLRTPCL